MGSGGDGSGSGSPVAIAIVRALLCERILLLSLVSSSVALLAFGLSVRALSTAEQTRFGVSRFPCGSYSLLELFTAFSLVRLAGSMQFDAKRV